MKLKSFFGAALACVALLSAGMAAAQNVPNYTKQGGVETHIGGQLIVDTAGKLDLAGAAQVTASGKAAVTANAGNSYAVTANQSAIVLTTDALTTAAGSGQAITVTDSAVSATSLVLVTRTGGTSTAGTPVIKAVPGTGSITITVDNKHASAAFNGTFVLSVLAIG